MKKTLRSAIKLSTLFIFGGSVYYCLEIIARGHSHYSMFFAGGASLACIDYVCNCCSFFKNKKVYLKATMGGFIITMIEFLIGIIFNMILKMNVWDYSTMPLNVFGQICLPFTLLWILLSYPALLVCNMFERLVCLPSTKKKS